MCEHEINLSKSGSTAWCADRERMKAEWSSIDLIPRAGEDVILREAVGRLLFSSCTTYGRGIYPHHPLSFLIFSLPLHFSLQSMYDSTR